ncbi:MAG TPA: acyl-ACP thioesterase domain-containing protein, partial [Rhodothermales bacterium]|nr:acyl-ACP thioesterase domain-containing protein [Rhodothermales bacterium]
VRYAHVGVGDTLTKPALLDLLLDAAGHDARDRGFALEALLSEGRAWVLNRITVAVQAPLPGLDETLHVTTWPAPPEGLLAARHFLVHDDGGTEIAVATTRWLLIDAARRRPLRIPPELADLSRDAPPAPLVPPDAAPTPEAFPPGVTFPVLRRDLDMNGHATSARYAEWLFEPMPDDLAFATPRLLDLSLRAETHRGDMLTAEAAETTPGLWHHRLVRSSDERVVATMQTEW